MKYTFAIVVGLLVGLVTGVVTFHVVSQHVVPVDQDKWYTLPMDGTYNHDSRDEQAHAQIIKGNLTLVDVNCSFSGIIEFKPDTIICNDYTIHIKH